MPQQLVENFAAQLGPMSRQALIANGGDVTSLRAHSTLRKDVWERIDETVIRVATARLAGIADLQSRGLTQPLGNLGVQLSRWERVSRFEQASQSMNPTSFGHRQRPEFDSQIVPIPVTHQGFTIGIRDQLASAQRGETLDTLSISLATRQVTERLELTLFQGSSIALRVNGETASIPGYLNFSDRITGNLTAAWTDQANRDILGDIEAMLADAYDDNKNGPFLLYVPLNYWAPLQEDYKAESERTFLERIRAYADIDDVRPSMAVPSDNVVLVQMDMETVDLGTIEPIQAVELSDSMFESEMMVFGCMVPRIKSDQEDQCGIIHYTTP